MNSFFNWTSQFQDQPNSKNQARTNPIKIFEDYIFYFWIYFGLCFIVFELFFFKFVKLLPLLRICPFCMKVLFYKFLKKCHEYSLMYWYVPRRNVVDFISGLSFLRFWVKQFGHSESGGSGHDRGGEEMISGYLLQRGDD